jgi:ParB/RepB/Spo0J family partition protein
MEVRTIALSSLTENRWNPNRMKVALFESLKANIEREGYLQPIIVRPLKNRKATAESRYEIIDGAHRFRALKELGHKEAQCVILNLTEKQAKILTVTMNRLRGEFDYVELSGLLKELEMEQEEIEKYLAYTTKEQEEILSLLRAPQVAQIEKIAQEGEILVEFLLTLPQEKIVERAVKVEAQASGKTRDWALASICEKYLRDDHGVTEKPGGVEKAASPR